MNVQARTNREAGLEDIMESMYSEDCGVPHGTTKRKKKVKEGDDPNVKQRTSALFKKADPKSPPPTDTVKCDKCNGDGCDHCNGTGKHVVKEQEGLTSDEGFQAFYDSLLKMRAEVDEYMTSYAHTTGAEDFKANVLDIITGYLGGASTPTPTSPASPTGTGQYNPTGSPRRQSQSPHGSANMSGLGM